MLDVVNPVVFVRAADFGLTGTEFPDEVDNDPDLLERIERIRVAACKELEYIGDETQFTAIPPWMPKLAFVSGAQTYTTSEGETVEAVEIDLTSRIRSVQKLYPDTQSR